MNIVIIGATSGIGHELWRHYSTTGNMVAVVGRRKAEIEKMKLEAPGNTTGYECDIAEIEATHRTLDAIAEEMGMIDLIIVCAGIGELNPDLDMETELMTVRVNVEGWTNCVDRAFNLFCAQGRGHLVAITSVGGLQPTAAAPAYSASKAYQINYVKSLQRKAKGSAVKVTEVRPGLVRTRMAKGEGLFWVMPADKVARAITKAIGRKRRLLVTDRRWRAVNFMLKHFG